MDEAILYDLLERRLRGTLNHNEEVQLADLLEQLDDNVVIRSMMRQIEREFGQPMGVDPAIELATFKKVVSSDKRLPTTLAKLSHGLKWRRAAAAAIFVCGAAVAYMSLRPKSTHAPTIAATQPAQILPGAEKAILTLADGKRIELDSLHAQTLQQSAWKLVNENGKLRYEGSLASSETHTLSTPRGGQYQVTLPDGTEVWLNAASSVTYPTAFTGSEREVTITGECYFEVSARSHQPFRVKLNGFNVQVLGTSFDINAYSNEPAATATLIKGSIKVLRQNDRGKSDEIILQPGQQAQVGKTISVAKSDADIVLAWKNGFFNFTGDDLPAVMRQLERWYNIDVKYEGDIPAFRFKGKMDRGVKLTDMQEMLAKMGLNTRLNERLLTIISKKN